MVVATATATATRFIFTRWLKGFVVQKAKLHGCWDQEFILVVAVRVGTMLGSGDVVDLPALGFAAACRRDC